jgi:hypothetical protein
MRNLKCLLGLHRMGYYEDTLIFVRDGIQYSRVTKYNKCSVCDYVEVVSDITEPTTAGLADAILKGSDALLKSGKKV